MIFSFLLKDRLETLLGYLILSSVVLQVSALEVSLVTDEQTRGVVDMHAIKQIVETLDVKFKGGSINVLELAETALAETEVVQANIDLAYKQSEQKCAEVFFVTACADDLNLKRRSYQIILKRIRVEAHTFIRRNRSAK
jgi:hypothetical protein